MTPFLLIGAAVLGQVALGRVMESPWFVPDIALSLLVVLMTQARARRVALAVFAACFASLFSVRHPALTAGAYLAVAAGVRMTAAAWDLTEPSLQRLAVGLAEGGWLLACAAGDHGAASTAGLICVRTLLTIICLPFVRPLGRFAAERAGDAHA